MHTHIQHRMRAIPTRKLHDNPSLVLVVIHVFARYTTGDSMIPHISVQRSQSSTCHHDGFVLVCREVEDASDVARIAEHWRWWIMYRLFRVFAGE